MKSPQTTGNVLPVKEYGICSGITSLAVYGSTIFAGTNAGLVEIDKKNWCHKYLTPLNSVLKSHWINGLDYRNGVLSIVSGCRDLVTYDSHNWQTFFPVPVHQLTRSGDYQCPFDKIGALWVAFHDGLASYDFKTWKLYSSMNIEYIQAIAVDNDCTVWLGTTDRLYLLDLDTCKQVKTGNADEDSDIWNTWPGDELIEDIKKKGNCHKKHTLLI